MAEGEADQSEATMSFESEVCVKDSSTDVSSASGVEQCGTVPSSSREQMMEHGNRFVQFVLSKNSTVDLRTIDERAINEYLRFFYFTLKTKQGHDYSPSSLICIRAGIQRYFDRVLGRPLNLPGNLVFMTSNRMLGQRARDYAKSSGGVARHYLPMLQSDRELMNKYFDGEFPVEYSMEERLQDWVLFTVFYYFGCAPQQYQQRFNQQQHQRQLIQRSALVFANDSEGREFATLLHNDDATGAYRVGRAASGTVQIYSGLDRLKAYLSCLPTITKNDSLFPKPLRAGQGYSASVNRGINYMQNFMRNISRKAQLSRFYSNHSIRLTRIQDLDQSGFSADEIRAVTGHRCGKSVKRCLKRRAGIELASTSTLSVSSVGDEASTTGADDLEFDEPEAPFVVMAYQLDNEDADVE